MIRVGINKDQEIQLVRIWQQGPRGIMGTLESPAEARTLAAELVRAADEVEYRGAAWRPRSFWVRTDAGGHRATPRWTLHIWDGHSCQPRESRCHLQSWTNHPAGALEPPQGDRKVCKTCLRLERES